MAEVTKERLLKFIRNNDLDLDESYPRSDWWKFRNERDSFRKQCDELINDMAEVKRKAKAFDKLKKHIDEEADSYMTLYRETKDPFYSLLNSRYDTLFGYMEELERADDER